MGDLRWSVAPVMPELSRPLTLWKLIQAMADQAESADGSFPLIDGPNGAQYHLEFRCRLHVGCCSWTCPNLRQVVHWHVLRRLCGALGG